MNKKFVSKFTITLAKYFLVPMTLHSHRAPTMCNIIKCGGVNKNAPQDHRNIRRCGLGRGSMSLRVGFEGSDAQTTPSVTFSSCCLTIQM